MSYLLVVLITFLVISSEVIGHLHFFFHGLPIYVLNLFFLLSCWIFDLYSVDISPLLATHVADSFC